MQTVAYVSSATSAFSEQELEALLDEARSLNVASGVTGVLLYSDGNFMQVIEGPTASVHTTYERIRASRRHTGIIELMNEPIARRAFPDWRMGLAQPGKSELLALSSARWQRLEEDAHGAESPGLTMLRKFWTLSQREC